MKNKGISDDDIIVLGGSEWKPAGNGAGPGKNASGRRSRMVLAVAATVLALCALLCAGRLVSFKYQYPKSRPDREIIARLSLAPQDSVSGVSLDRVEIMGVKLRIYRISGLEAHFADTVPDFSDPSVYLITRSADYRIKNDRRMMIGDFIQDGEILARGNWRAGFMAIADGNAQIGVSRGGKISRYTARHGGSFFRQLALVTAGTVCDGQYILRGKVSRCAYARDIDGQMYFIETENPEGLSTFADALAEYGFTDAIYVTGGAQPHLFFRSHDGTPHGGFIDDKPHKLVVWTTREQYASLSE